MRVSLFRNRVWIAFLLIALAYLALDFWHPGDRLVRIGVVIVAAVVVAQLIAWIFSLLLAKRIRGLNRFTERLLDTPLSGDELPEADDELGILNQSLHRMSTRIRDLVGTLSLESDRREAILASMVEGVLAVDNRLQVIFCNDPLARVLGARPPVEEGTPVLDIVRDPALVNLLTQVIASGESVKHKIQLSSGEGKSFEAQAAPLAMPERRGAIVILHDITDLERLERVRKDFVANVSHELRTPLTAIRGYAETLLSGALADTDNNRRFVEIIQSHAIRLNNIAADLMVLSELESGRPASEPEVVSVRDAVEMALSTLESEARVRGVNLIPPDHSDHFVLGHKIRLEQALVNLLDNAVKFNRPNGEARIETGLTTDGKVCIVVSDTGSGIPSDDLPRIFERFYRVDKARSRAVGGTGLGLSIVKHVVERMNGTIKVESHFGRGSSFTILIPALSPFEDADAAGATDDHHSRHAEKHAMLHDSDGVV
jgi:two-component system, OmpR family, phosphate regulon sensor histidine kinase PhoR